MSSKQFEFEHDGVKYITTEGVDTILCEGCCFYEGTLCVAPYNSNYSKCFTGNIIWIKKESKEEPKDSSQEDKKSNPTEGRKYDSGKRQWWYMWQFLPELEQVTDILTFGDKKYPAEDGSNWRLVDNAERRYTSALMRHLSAYLQGEKVDAESGKSHLAHMITNALFLMWFDRK
jgi:hypothetical protein